MADPRRLRPDHAPTPFTADQIRAGCPEGRTVTSVTRTADAVTTTETVRFSKCDRVGAVFRSSESSRAVTWADLQAHASFPEADTDIEPETIETPLGTLDTSRYTVVRGEATHIFWFAKDRPGMPVRQTTVVAGEVSSTTTVIADEIT